MSDVNVSCESVYAMFDELNQKNRQRVFRSAVTKASGRVIRETRKELRKHVKNTRTKNKWNGRTLEWGIKRKVHKKGKGATIHILGDFRLKFFELGTKTRYAKKGYKKPAHRGAVTGSHFFQTTLQREEKPVFNEMANVFIQQINKINAKYHNK